MHPYSCPNSVCVCLCLSVCLSVALSLPARFLFYLQLFTRAHVETWNVLTPELLWRPHKGLTRRERARLMPLSSTQRWKREAENRNHCMRRARAAEGRRSRGRGRAGPDSPSTLVFALLMLTRTWVRSVAEELRWSKVNRFNTCVGDSSSRSSVY
jgi:hypothetical protein